MIRVAVIGAGGMGAVHIRVLATMPDVQITWIADQNLERARSAAVAVGARPTTDNNDAIAAADVDAVIVATPTPFHRPVVKQAAAHGKHVFCEKPIARTVGDAEAMIAACDAAAVRLMVGHVVRFFPEYARAKEVLDAGTLGTIGVARTSRLSFSPQGERAWFNDLEQSGGMVVDLMIHELDTLRWWFGDVERIYAKGLTFTPYQPTRDYALATLRFANGVIAHVEASWAHAGFRTMFEISGEHGTLRHDSEATAAIRLERSNWADSGPGMGPRAPVSYRGHSGERPYAAELRHFVDRIGDGKPFLTEGVEGLRALELSLATLESIRTGRPVTLGGRGTEQAR
jgi:UDP-N-acetylglucosamine 3-dehydrogenase